MNDDKKGIEENDRDAQMKREVTAIERMGELIHEFNAPEYEGMQRIEEAVLFYLSVRMAGGADVETGHEHFDRVTLNRITKEAFDAGKVMISNARRSGELPTPIHIIKPKGIH